MLTITEAIMPAGITVRPFSVDNAHEVRQLFIQVNRLLAPPEMKDAFEAYIARSLRDEMDRISEYYDEHGGQFWVAARNGEIVGMFGLESVGPDAMELRRMYVHPSVRRSGIGSRMLQHAEDYCRERGKRTLDLSTSELQQEALRFYETAGYELLEEVVAEQGSNKTIGGGIRRYHFEKRL